MTERVFHPGLEGLRGISVLAVLIFHSSPTLLPGGFLGVSTFFTLSGFLITGLLAREWEATGTIKLRAFWGRRLRRLLPASLLALLGIACAGAFLADVTQREHFTGDGLSALFYV
ncbi:MAG: peptidoglycan/LPS O-acetylase OafA/YrhL, partial [Myxococcota bacterium]